MKSNPLVSIVMPVYNSEDYIDEAVQSIINQTYSNWELISVDDCSTDNTVKKLKYYEKKYSKIHLYLHSENKGAAETRNSAIKKAKGDLIAFLDSDDLWKTNKLEKQVNFMLRKDIVFSCTYYGKLNENSEDLEKLVTYKDIGDYNHLLKECPGNSTVMYNAKQLGKFLIPDIKKRNDYVMWLQVIKKAKFLYCLEEELSWHRVRASSLSANKLSLIKYHWYIYRRVENLTILMSMNLVSHWILKAIKAYF